MVRITSELRCLVCQNQTIADSQRGARRRPAPRGARAVEAGQERRRGRRLHDRALRRLRALPAAAARDHPAALVRTGAAARRRRARCSWSCCGAQPDARPTRSRPTTTTTIAAARRRAIRAGAPGAPERGERDPLAAARARLLQLKAAHDAGKLDDARYQNSAAPSSARSAKRCSSRGARPSPARPSRAWSRVPRRRARARRGRLLADRRALARGARRADNAASRPAPRSRRKRREPDCSRSRQWSTSSPRACRSNPDDAEGWTMLARSYTVLGRFDDALPAYAHASELQPKNRGCSPTTPTRWRRPRAARTTRSRSH